jgi:hypothetical protein
MTETPLISLIDYNDFIIVRFQNGFNHIFQSDEAKQRTGGSLIRTEDFFWENSGIALTNSVDSHSIKNEMTNILAFLLKGAGSYGIESGSCR